MSAIDELLGLAAWEDPMLGRPVAAEDIAATIDFIVHLDPGAAINEILIRPARQGF